MTWLELGISILSIVAPGLGAILWFAFKSVRDEAEAAGKQAEALKEEFGKYRLYVAEHYVTQVNLTEKIAGLQSSIERLIVSVDRNAQEMRETIGQLYDRIDRKADK